MPGRRQQTRTGARTDARVIDTAAGAAPHNTLTPLDGVESRVGGSYTASHRHRHGYRHPKA
ncbi:hypothetical protein [Streptomyces canus]|uniref:hypothetical protein n=1 Tax=Streptomyces canus TaxID=58343 RepID=UPI00278491AF|nr:hypothetical protein [Streptomyces canus]MDQ1067960.1 hypothetical protein [Streptomyces canus]